MSAVVFEGEDHNRVEETRRRRRMMDGTWSQDLTEAITKALGAARTVNLGVQTRSMNYGMSVVQQLAVTYEEETIIGHDDRDQAELMRELLNRIHWQGLAKRHNKSVLWLRESLYKVEYSPSTNRLVLRLVTPDKVKVKADDDDPNRLLEVRHVRMRDILVDGVKKRVPVWDVWDLTTGGLRLLTNAGDDVTVEVLGEVPPPLVDSENKPIQNWILYHAEPGDKLWDYNTWCEIVDGTFDLAVLWNGWLSVMRDASWSQRGTIDLEAPGAVIRQDGTASITTSQTSLLNLVTAPGKTGGSTFQFNPPVDPKNLADAILAFQTVLTVTIGLYPGDLQERRSESGVAIHLKRSAQRRFAMSHEAQFRDGDTQLLSTLAKMSNRFVERAELMAEDGYTLTYQYLDDPVSDRMDELEYNAKLVEAGMLSPSEQYMSLHPGVTQTAALEAVLQASWERMAIAKALGTSVVSDDVLAAVDDAAAMARDTLARLGDTLPPDVAAALRAAAATSPQN